MRGETGTRNLLERDQQLALIEATIDAADEGHGLVTLVRGPAGIGKTELLSAASSSAEGRGFRVLAARGGEFEMSFGFGIARQLFGPPLEDAEERRTLFDGAAALAGPALFADGADQAERQTGMAMGDPAAPVQHGLHWLVANLAERAPLLIAVDDLQWADPESAAWLLYLARRLADLPVSVVLAIRDGEPGLDEGVLSALERESRTIALDPLSEAATAELLRAEFDPGADAEFCAAAYRAAGGNPLYVHELIAAAREAQLPATAESISSIEDLRPTGISRSVLARLGRLGDEASSVAEAVAILGDGAAPRRVAALAELDSNELAPEADALNEAGILSSTDGLEFAHPLIRAAIYGALPASGRALGHARAARLLAADGAGAEEIGGQLLLAAPGDVRGAVTTLREAAKSAMHRSAPKAAIAYLRRAFAEPEADQARGSLLPDLLVAAVTAADLTGLEGICEDPVAELGEDPSVLRDATAGDALVAWLVLAGRVGEVNDQIARGVAATIAAGDHLLALRRETLSLAIADVKPDEALVRLDRHRAQLRPGSQEERIWLAMRGWWRHMQGGSAAESAELARRGIDRGQLLDLANLGPVFGQAVLVLLRADELDEAEPWIEAMIDDARRRGPPYAMSAFGLRSCLAHRRGDLGAAVQDGRRTVQLCREHNIALGLAINLWFLIDALTDRGEFEEAQAELAAAGFDGLLPDFWWFFPIRYGRARLWLELGRVEEGIADLRELVRRRQDTRPEGEPVASTLALALHAVGGDQDEIEHLLDWELEAAREWSTPRAMGVALRAGGLVAGGRRGIMLLDESVQALRASPARIDLARSLTDLGSALRRANRRMEARDRLREGLELASRCGARAIAEHAREELRASGAKPRRVMLTGVESLTPSELRVAKLAAAGLANREIAAQLVVSVKTVETHLSNAYRKLDVAGRPELTVALADTDVDQSPEE